MEPDVAPVSSDPLSNNPALEAQLEEQFAELLMTMIMVDQIFEHVTENE